MKKIVVAAIGLMVAGEPALAQTATAVGTGVANSRSRSDSTAVAVSGQGGTGGNPVANVTIQGTTIPTATQSTITQQGTTTLRTNPAVFAPGLTAAGLETCLGSASGGLSLAGFGLTGGSSYPDEGCQARLDSRTLWSFGLRRAALARLCLRPDIYRSMPDVCVQYLPQVQQTGYAVVERPQIAPSYRMQAETSSNEAYSGGPIMLVEGKTGKDRLCRDYDAPKQKCKHWDGEVSPKHLAKGKKAVTAPVVAETTTAPAVNSEGK